MRFNQPIQDGDGFGEPHQSPAFQVVQRLRSSFKLGKSQPYEFRKKQLENLVRFLDENVEVLCGALHADLHKPRQEAMLTEIEIVKNEILSALGNLKKWMAPHPVEKTVATLVDYPYIQYEPFGVVLIIGPWNYPINLILGPLVGAIAAGNCAIVKPSEVSANCERFMEELLPRYLDPDCYEVVCGGPADTGLLLKERFDHIFYTGNTSVGKIVYKAAAEHLTPVILELGGKSPCFVDKNADMALTAKRIMWGKMVNAGQTCIAPDYIMCTDETQGKLVEAMRKVSKEFMLNAKEDYCHIINARHFNRLSKLLDSQNIAFGGDVDASTHYISPTVLINVDPASAVMQEEIFGPILPIVPVQDLDSAIRFVNDHEKPLAVYCFAKDNKVSEKFLKGTTSGGACINDVIMHFAVDALPFGGVGHSGTGGYHGFHSFQAFSHKRGVLWKKHGWDFLFLTRYPPYSDFKIKATQALLKYRPAIFPKWLGTVAVFGIGAVSGYLTRVIIAPFFTLRFALKYGYSIYKFFRPGDVVPVDAVSSPSVPLTPVK